MMSNRTITFIAEHFDDLGGQVSSYAPVHPCFLYESLWCAAAFVVLHIYFKHRKFDGEVFLMYAGLYGLGRFFIESTRTDSLYLMNIKVSQLIAGASVVASIVLIIIFRSIAKRNDDYKLFAETELSKAQLKEYEMYEENNKAKKELKEKIKKAKAEGESYSELEKEYEEKFGKHAKKLSDDVKEDESKAEDYKSILDDDEESEASDEEEQTDDNENNEEESDDE